MIVNRARSQFQNGNTFAGAAGYYVLVMLLLFYVLGLSTLAPFQGERMRFLVLGLMMPIATWNLVRSWQFATRFRLSMRMIFFIS